MISRAKIPYKNGYIYVITHVMPHPFLNANGRFAKLRVQFNSPEWGRYNAVNFLK